MYRFRQGNLAWAPMVQGQAVLLNERENKRKYKYVSTICLLCSCMISKTVIICRSCHAADRHTPHLGCKEAAVIVLIPRGRDWNVHDLFREQQHIKVPNSQSDGETALLRQNTLPRKQLLSSKVMKMLSLPCFGLQVQCRQPRPG